MERRRVLLVQPSLQPPGGGNGVAAWMLQALTREHHVTVLSWRQVDVDPINRFFGTTLRRSDFDTIQLPRTWRAIPELLPVPASLIRSALLMRYTRRFHDRFDVVVGGHNETDYGRRGIQYIHYPTYLRPRPAVDFRWYHRFGPALDRYYRFADRLADFSFERMQANLTLANSNWTAAHVERFLGIQARTLYPPVAPAAAPLPWSDRADGFLAVGRISPEKDYQRLIAILARVRVHRPAVTLTIVGTTDRHGRRYYDQLRAAAVAAGSWVTFRHDVTREELRSMLASHRYGIHGMREEHFGMAPAEMARAGMIVWVPNGGGQVEIVASPDLTFDSDEEAADSIGRVMASAGEQGRLREHLASRVQLFSAESFVSTVQSIVRDFRE
ncbi:MAG TPA: glycosyltransferase family 4 protein [Vicinamibacterales bacterium]|nr:glycosyltransferase family 4 protein [Vicinamibacterales bacterium]